MPYIADAARKLIENGGRAESPGELNFIITTAILTYAATHDRSYQTINDILGALEGAKLEFYRRVAVPYENSKIDTNGDVYQ